MVGQVLEEGVVRCDRPGMDGASGQRRLVIVGTIEIVGTGRGQDRPGVPKVPAVAKRG